MEDDFNEDTSDSHNKNVFYDNFKEKLYCFGAFDLRRNSQIVHKINEYNKFWNFETVKGVLHCSKNFMFLAGSWAM